MKSIISFMAILVVATMLNSCGATEDTSQLSDRTVTVHKYQAFDGRGITAPWLSQAGSRQKDGSILFERQSTRNCIIYGPKANFRPATNGPGHLSAEVDLVLIGGTVTVDLVGNDGKTVYDSKKVSALLGQPRFSGTVALKGPIFREPVYGIEVRVCNAISDLHLWWDDSNWGPPRQVAEEIIHLRITESRIIYN